MPEPREPNRRRLNRSKRPVLAPWLPRALAGAVLLLAPLLAIGGVSPQAVAAADPLPTLTTDKADYSPNETVHITGFNFVPGLAYDIPVIRPDGSIVKGDGNFNPDFTYTCPGGAPECWDTVTAGPDGSFTYDYILDGIAGDYEVRAYPSPWSGDRSLPAIATATFTDGNVKFDVAPTGTTSQFVETLYKDATDCTGNVKNNYPKTLNGSSGDNVGVGDSESLRLDAAATSDQGGAFVSWSSTDSPASPFTVIPGTGGKSICIPGFKGDGTRNYLATYGSPPPATSAQVVVNKDFSPDSAASVTVALTCSSGSVANDDVTASEADPANFTVTGFSAGATCTATETPPPGYTANQAGCASQPITNGGTTTCTITNTDIAPTVTLTKTASPSSLAEPGGLFTFTLTITNTSNAADTVTITALTDSQSGAADASNTFADCTALIGTSLAPGASASCSYAVAHSQAGSYSNTASVTVADEEASTASASDGETVTVTNVNPALSVNKTVSPASVSEGGVGSQSVTYTYTVTNTSSASTDPVTITSLSDSALGPLAGDADCHVGTVLAPGASCSFTVTTDVPSKNAGATQDNTFTATATDDDAGSSPASATASASVSYTNVNPAVSLSKSASPPTLAVPGGLFTFTLTITNTSSASTDPVTITSLTDTQSGSADASNDFSDCAALVGVTLAPGASVSCSYAVAHSQAGSYTNTASVTVTDDEGSSASATDSETVFVTFVENGTTLTNSAFRLQDDLSQWEIAEFEILKQKDGTIVATNPGQFYMHTRVQKVGGAGPIHIVMDWDENGFVTQGATPVHCYIRPPSGGWSETPCTIVMNASTGTVTADFATVPDGYTVWVTVHLDYKLKGTKSTDMTPKSYAFTSTWTGGPPPGADIATLMGYPKKTTVMYGYVLDGSGQPLAGAKVSITVDGVTYTYTTGADGFYVFYGGQKCSDDGVTCSGTYDSTTTLALPNATYTLTIDPPTGYGPTSSTCGNTTATVTVNALGKAFRKDVKLYANGLCP